MALKARSDRARLVEIARLAVAARVLGAPPPDVPPELNVPCAGVFVTLRCGGCLRGCLGTLDGRLPLGEAVVRLAGDAAEHDPRFPPLGAAELEGLGVDISVLAPPRPVQDPSEIVIGRDGLIVGDGHRRGLLLPQVAIEHGWDCEQFLAHTCLKAGLPWDAWRNGASILRFEAEVFGDSP